MTKKLKLATPDVPVMALGRITDPAEAEGVLSQGDIDLVGLGRPLITDATWSIKAAEGKAADIRYCVSCNTCWKIIVTHTPIACDNNPAVGKPGELEALPRVESRKKVAVVGAGIAGLEAAMTAAQRGHEVTVSARQQKWAARLRLHAAMPVAESISSIYDYQYVEAQRAGVKFVLGREVDAATIVESGFDAVVLATGATMSWPVCLPQELKSEGSFPTCETP